MIMKKIICLLLVLIFPCIVLVSCGEDKDIVTDVKFSVYDNGDGDMISFYMTSDTSVYGSWNHTFNDDNFEVFFESEELKDYGSFGNKTTASYKTLILKPLGEGEANISFSLTQGDKEYEFSLKVEKDENGSLRIKAEEASTDEA